MATEWRGAIEFAGMNVNVALHKPMNKTRGESWKVLGPDLLPPKSLGKVAASTGEKIPEGGTVKGYQVSKGQYVQIDTDAAGEKIKTRELELNQFAPVGTVPWKLATRWYMVTGDDRVPGSQGSVNVLWNGLRSTKLVYATQSSPRGGMDNVWVFTADADALWCAELPFVSELLGWPDPGVKKDKKAEALFAQVIDQMYEVEEAFDHGAFESEYKARRQKIIDAAIAGETIVAPEEKTPDEAPDLMAALEASLATEMAKAKA